MIRRVCTAALLLVCGAVGFAADTTSTQSKPDVMQAGGEEVYSHICQACHMPDAKGAEGAVTSSMDAVKRLHQRVAQGSKA